MRFYFPIQQVSPLIRCSHCYKLRFKIKLNIFLLHWAGLFIDTALLAVSVKKMNFIVFPFVCQLNLLLEWTVSFSRFHFLTYSVSPDFLCGKSHENKFPNPTIRHRGRMFYHYRVRLTVESDWKQRVTGSENLKVSGWDFRELFYWFNARFNVWFSYWKLGLNLAGQEQTLHSPTQRYRNKLL